MLGKQHPIPSKRQDPIVATYRHFKPQETNNELQQESDRTRLRFSSALMSDIYFEAISF